jgi:Lar family restriction alleviation protein
MSADSDMVAPCPFCGSEDVGFTDPPAPWFVQCRSCLTEGPSAHGDDSKRGAARAWNTRAALDAPGIGELVEALEEARGAQDPFVGAASDVSNTAISVGNGADTVMRQISSAITMVDAAISRARATVETNSE